MSCLTATSAQIHRPVLSGRPALATPVGLASPACRSAGLQRRFQAQPSKRVVLRAALEKGEGEGVDIEQITKDLQDRWDKVENKTSVAVYAAGAVVAVWLSSTIVGAVNAVPLVPKVLELVGLGYTAWFVYRYLLFKSSREELVADIDELKKKISGAADNAADSAKSTASSAQDSIKKSTS